MTEATEIPFYQRSEEDRVAITVAAIGEGRTVLERWAVLSSAEADPWNARAAMAAEWLIDEPAVADLGCGVMNLERYLRADQVYVPIDVVARDARTIVCDLNRDTPPSTAARAVVCLGLLEYLHRPSDLLRVLHDQYETAVLSYCVTDAPDAPPSRRQHAWVNDFRISEIEGIVRQAGWTIRESRWVDNMQRLWRLDARAGAPGTP